MTDLDPAIWDNPTLGSANNLPFLDEVEAQIIENVNAAREGRDPNNLERRGRYTDETTNMSLVDKDALKEDEGTDSFTMREQNTRRERSRVDEAFLRQDSLQENKETKDKVPVVPDKLEEEKKEVPAQKPSSPRPSTSKK